MTRRHKHQYQHIQPIESEKKPMLNPPSNLKDKNFRFCKEKSVALTSALYTDALKLPCSCDALNSQVFNLPLMNISMYDLLICDIAYIFAVAIVALCQVLNLPLMDIGMLDFLQRLTTSKSSK